jgi:hypothetical protein
MAIVVACKLPHGLSIPIAIGRVINLNGPNEGSYNGLSNDDEKSSYGFGLTKLDDRDAGAYEQWAKSVTFKEDGKTKLDEPFAAIENGALMTFKTESEARSELKGMASAITSGFEGVDPDDPKNGVKTDKELMAKK